MVGLVAGPGVGKSRLLREFANHARTAGAIVAESHCASHGRNVPLLSYLQGRRELFDLEDRDDPATIRRKIRARFDEMYPELREYIPLWCDLFGAPDADHPAPPMSPEERHRLLIDWEKRSHGAIAGTRNSCVVVLVEDLHWIDAASEAIIESIVAITPSYRHMFLCTYRPEYSPPWVSKSFYRQLPLPTLTQAAAGTLIGTLLGSELADSELAQLLQDRCGGTPFFVEEMIQSLAESGYLEGERGAYRLTQPVQDIPLPSTVQSNDVLVQANAATLRVAGRAGGNDRRRGGETGTAPRGAARLRSDRRRRPRRPAGDGAAVMNNQTTRVHDLRNRNRRIAKPTRIQPWRRS